MIRARLLLLPAASLAATLACVRPALAQSAPAPTPAQTQEVQQVRDELTKLKQDFDLLRQQYDDRMSRLEERLKEIGGTSGPAAASAAVPVAVPPVPAQSAAAPAVPTTAQMPSAAPAPADLPTLQQTPNQNAAQQAAAAGSSKVFNPDMSAIGNFVGVTGKNPMNTEDRKSVV